MKEKKELEQPGKAQEEATECAEPSKREFVTKLVTAVGAVAAASLLAGGDNADAAIGATLPVEYKEIKYSFHKLERGFRFEFCGENVGSTLTRMGLQPTGSSLDKGTISLEFHF